MTMQEYLNDCHKAQNEHPEWRWGQTLFNVLYDLFPILAVSVAGTELDPFYRNERQDVFLKFVEDSLIGHFGG